MLVINLSDPKLKCQSDHTWAEGENEYLTKKRRENETNILVQKTKVKLLTQIRHVTLYIIYCYHN